MFPEKSPALAMFAGRMRRWAQAGQQANWAFDVSRVGYFSEGGWVTQFHLSGDRNYASVEGWNLVNDAGWYLIARRLGRRRD